MKSYTRAIICSTLCALLLAFGHNASATSFTIGDANELGFVQYGIPTGDANITAYVDALRSLSLGGSTTVTFGPKTNTVTRSLNVFSPLDPAVLVSRVSYVSPGSSISIDLGTGYEYLFAKYDGPNYGSEVWYVGGLSGIITIPGFAGQYGISTTALFTPFSDSVPDGGNTVALLGVALTGLAGIRAKFQKN